MYAVIIMNCSRINVLTSITCDSVLKRSWVRQKLRQWSSAEASAKILRQKSPDLRFLQKVLLGQKVLLTAEASVVFVAKLLNWPNKIQFTGYLWGNIQTLKSNNWKFRYNFVLKPLMFGFSQKLLWLAEASVFGRSFVFGRIFGYFENRRFRFGRR